MKRSAVWKFFDQDEDSESSKASCTICGEVLSHANNTSNLFKHLKCKHILQYKTVDAERKEQEKANQAKGSKRASTKQQMTIQSSLDSTIPYSTSSKRWKGITELMLGMIAKDVQPLSVVENEGFQKFVKELEPRYQPPSYSTITRSLLPQKYEKLKGHLKGDLSKVKHVALTTDLWTSNRTLSYLTLTCHFINEEMILCSKVLETLHVEKTHTAPKLAEELRDIAETWEITEKICCIITDNVANIVAAINLLGWRHLPCFAHTLNLIVQDSLQAGTEISNLQKKCKDVVSFFHRSTKATEKLLSLQSHTSPEGKALKLKQDVETRWNSTFYMMERLVDLHEVVTTALCLLGKNNLCLSNYEFDLMKEVVSTSRAFERATREMSSDSFISVLKIIPLVHLLQSSVTATAAVDELSSPENRLKAELKHQMRRRFSQLESNYILSASTILDPRFKKIAFCSPDTAERTVERISHEVGGLIPAETAGAATQSTQSTESVTDSELWASFDKKVAEASKHRTSSVESAVEVRRYIQEKNIPRHDDPLEWWKQQISHYPHLSQYSKKFLCIPATSVPSERLFSKAGELVSKKRSSLKY